MKPTRRQRKAAEAALRRPGGRKRTHAKRRSRILWRWCQRFGFGEAIALAYPQSKIEEIFSTTTPLWGLIPKAACWPTSVVLG
jgi:hypothetical protein